MTTKQKKILKTVGIVSGILLLGVGVYALYRRHTRMDVYYNPSPNTNSRSVKQTYSTDQIKRMQSWLLTQALIYNNNTVRDAINSSGGIDGMMGEGFSTALNEAIRLGWV